MLTEIPTSPALAVTVKAFLDWGQGTPCTIQIDAEMNATASVLQRAEKSSAILLEVAEEPIFSELT